MDIDYYERTMQSMEEARMVNRGIDDYEKGKAYDNGNYVGHPLHHGDKVLPKRFELL